MDETNEMEEPTISPSLDWQSLELGQIRPTITQAPRQALRQSSGPGSGQAQRPALQTTGSTGVLASVMSTAGPAGQGLYHGREVPVRGVAPDGDSRTSLERQTAIQRLARAMTQPSSGPAPSRAEGPLRQAQRLALSSVEGPASYWFDLVPEPDNPYDPAAVAVYGTLYGVRQQFGYLPREVSQALLPEIQRGRWVAKLSRIVGGHDGKSWGLRLQLFARPEPKGRLDRSG